MTESRGENEPGRIIGEKAAQLVQPGMAVGLGTGKAASAFIRALGARTRSGLSIAAVATSRASHELAKSLGIKLFTLDRLGQLDLAVDGADEVDPQLRLVKGLGGALLREKIVAEAANEFVVLVGKEKLSPKIGTRGVVPIEVVPFATASCQRRLEKLGISAQLRTKNAATYLSDNGNHILDLKISGLDNPQKLEDDLKRIPGVVGTGLFLNHATRVFIEDPTAPTGMVEQCRSVSITS